MAYSSPSRAAADLPRGRASPHAVGVRRTQAQGDRSQASRSTRAAVRRFPLIASLAAAAAVAGLVSTAATAFSATFGKNVLHQVPSNSGTWGAQAGAMPSAQDAGNNQARTPLTARQSSNTLLREIASSAKSSARSIAASDLVSTARSVAAPYVAGRGQWHLTIAGAVIVLALAFMKTKVWLDTPSRPYIAGGDQESNSVRAEYDQWTREGVLEHYWGEHIHMGSYSPMASAKGYNRADGVVKSFLRATWHHVFGGYKGFVDAKLDFSKEMLEWSGAKSPKRILDVGCGIGGTSRFLARSFPDAQVTGITLSPEQAARAGQLAKEAGLTNVRFEVVNALDMSFADGSFDLVWGCESGEHMPDKKRYIEEMTRVLEPGGKLAVATWCERDPRPPFTPEERVMLKYVYEEWSHPYFISIGSYGNLMEDTGALTSVETDDWTERTLPSWRHSVWVGVWSPWYWMKVTLGRPKAFLGFLRDAYCLEMYHRAMDSGLLQYGMIKAVKKN